MEILEREIQLDDGANFEFENPQTIKTINVQKQYFDDLDYQEEYEHIKEKNKEIFKEKQKNRLEEIVSLLSCDILGGKSSNDLANLIQIKSKNGYWKPENENDFRNIIQDFKELYNHIGEKNINKENICTVMLKIINTIKKYQE